MNHPSSRDGSPRASLFDRIARATGRRPRRALGAWLVALVAISALAGLAGSDYRNDFSLPGTESQTARELLQAASPAQAGDSVQVVVQAGDGVEQSAVRERVDELVAEVRSLPGVAQVRSPYDDRGAVSADGTIAFATVTLTGTAQDVPDAQIERIVDTAHAAESDALRVEVGGDAVRGLEESGGAGEAAGLLAALVILVLLFGSLVAASLPVITAVFAVGTTLALVALASHIAQVADFTGPIMMLVGLGVGIDYALLIFARYRSELLAGADRTEAMRGALNAAGRTVSFAGCTVIIALMGLVALGLGALQGLAVAVALTVLMTMVASLTLLPALLHLLGARIERSVRRRAKRASRADGTLWRRWSGAVQRRPVAALVPALALLAALCAPALDLRLGFADAGTDPPSSTTRQAYDLLAEGFGPGYSGRLLVVAEGAGEETDDLARALRETPGIAAASPPVATDDDDVTFVAVTPASTPQAPETRDLVVELRERVLPPFEQRTGARVLVGGTTATAIDFTDKVGARMPLFVAIVVGLSFVLLMLVFRSVLIPLKAAILNLLSIGAALGVVALVFGEGTLGAQAGPVETSIPVMMFAIVYGLSMDYEVFLMARIHEHYARTRDASGAIREGLATTGGVITAAGAIMVVVFAAFLLAPNRMLQQFGLGLATAILVDATIIRCLIVPAVMQLLGDRAWWLPVPVARRLPRVALEHA